METIDRQFIGGELVASHGVATQDVYNPFDNTLIGRVTLADSVDVENAIAGAKAAFPAWSRTTLEERKRWLARIDDQQARG